MNSVPWTPAEDAMLRQRYGKDDPFVIAIDLGRSLRQVYCRAQVLGLADARERTLPVNPVEAMRRQLAVFVFGAVKEADVEQMVGKLKEMALAGDHKAMKMYFELIGVMGKQQAAASPAGDGAGLKPMAESLQDLADEIRLSKAAPSKSAAQLGHANVDAAATGEPSLFAEDT